MNISTTPRRLAQGLLVLCFTLATLVGANAQCSDFVSFPPGPVVINLTLSAGGSVNLTNAVLNANGFTKNGACDYWLSTNPDPLNLAAYSNTPIAFSCADVASSPQTWYVRVGGLPLISDDMGPGATVVPITVNIIDNIPPTITTDAGPHARNADATPAGSCQYTIVAGDAGTLDFLTANDNCPAAVIQYNIDNIGWVTGTTVVGQILSGTGPHTIQWRITDASGQVASASTITVNVSDATAPTVMCPMPVVTTTDPATNCSRVVSGIAATYSDNCSVTSVTWTASAPTSLASPLTGINDASGTTFQLGVTTVDYFVSDGINPAVNCAFTVTVNDNDAPVITCPMPMTVNAAGSPACDYTVTDNSFDATVFENCSLMPGQPVVASTPGYNGLTTLNGAAFSVGTTAVTWSATDMAGNVATCSFNVTVNDVTPPTVTALPPGLVAFQPVFDVNTAPGSCSQTVSWYRPNILGGIAATHAASDCSGSVTLTENATVAINCPGMSCVNDPSFFVTNGVTPFPYDETNPLHWVTPVSAEFPVGTTVISYDIEDGLGNTTTITVTVNVHETELPVAKCVTGPVPVSLDPLLGVALVTPAIINNGSTDNCGIDDITVSPSLLNCDSLGTRTVTMTVTDNAGNTASCTTQVFITDNTLPVIGCPSSFVVAANAMCEATVPGLVFNVGTSSPAVLEYFDNALDPCGLIFEYKVNANPFVNYNAVQNPMLPPDDIVSQPVDLSFLVLPAGNNSVTLRATDGSGNIAVCNFTVSVQDQTGPTYATPANPGPAAGDTIIANVPNISSCSAKAIWADPVFVDQCPGAVMIVSQSAFSNVTIFSADNGGVSPVTYVFKDAAGNLSTHTFFVKVVDNQSPVANCKNITVNLSASIGAGTVSVPPASVDNSSTDNCGYSYVNMPVSYTCANIGSNNYTLVITDDAGNTASCVSVVTVQDVTAPTFTCPLDVTVNANANCVGLVSGTATATDNCSVTQYEYDVDPPAAVNFQLINTGLTANLSNIPALPLGVNVVTLRASDASGNSSTCTYSITVRDVTPPVFAGVPANVTVGCTTIPPVTNPTATDNCGTATVVYSGQTFSPGVCSYTITRTWVASDDAIPANTVSVSQVITVQDITGPVFSPAFIPSGTVNINVSGPLVCTGDYTLTVNDLTDISDACNGVSGIAYALTAPGGMMSSGALTFAMGVYTMPISSFAIGTNVVTLTATDGCGNPTTKVVNIVVTDNQAPVFQGDYAAAPTGNCGKVFTLPNTSNNCDQLFIWARPAMGEIVDCGMFNVTETINNQSVQSFVSLLNPYATNPHATVTAQFPVGETRVTYTATQGTNVSTCSFIVKILDTQAPSITCPPNTNLSIAAGCTAAATVPTYPPASISDNCPNNVSIMQSPAPGTLVSSIVPVVAGNTFDVTLVAQDTFPNNLLSTPCTFTVTLVDSQSPQPLIASLPNIVSNCTKDTVIAPGATDCNGVSIDTLWGTPSVAVMMVLPPAYPGGPPSYVLNPGNYVITWSYTDPQNNTTTQPQSVFITVDVTPPVAIAQSANVVLDAMGNGFITAVQLDNGSFDQDNCGLIDLSIRTGVGPNFVYVDTLFLDCDNLANMGVNNVVFAVTDINGNISTASTTVTVTDVTSPTFVNPWTAGQMDTLIQACQAVPEATEFPQTAADQCDIAVNVNLVEVSTQDTVGCAKYSYMVSRTWTATDDSGNTAVRTQKIVVTDTQAPVFAANTPATVTFNTASNALMCQAAVNFNMAIFVSDCQDSADLTITNTLISAPMGNTFVIPSGANISAANYPVGEYVLRFTATDNCGNSSTRDLTLRVVDATPPTAVCINGVSASLQPSGTVNVTVNQFNNNSYDNCPGPLTLLIQRLDAVPLENPTPNLEYTCADADGVTQHPVKLFVSDGIGNMSMCLTYIVIQDNVAPTITCPANDTLDCAANTAPQILGFATAMDNCPNNVTIDFSDTLMAGTGSFCEVLSRIWTATDLANNVSSCVQMISLQDTTKPVLSAYTPDVTISCSEPLPAPAAITATDNCTTMVDVLFEQDTINIAQGPCGQFTYTIVRTRTAIDDCGNQEVHTRLINVEDVTAPEFAGMPDTIILNTAQFPPNATCSVPWVFNVGQFLEDCSPDSIMMVTNNGPFGDGALSLSGDYPIGSYQIKFTATDACGNIGTDSLVVIVRDNSVPTLVCNNNVVIALGTNGEAMINASDIDLGSTDNCAIDTLVLSQDLFDCADLGFQAVTMTATDINGNTNSCAVQVEVTLGVNAGFNLDATGTPVSYLGATNGSATATATGGTGVFTYLWSTMDTTAMINGLAAGTYTVSVTDANSGCFTIDTVMIQDGPTVTINAGTGDGCQGETISIAITADNFISVSGFNFGLDLVNGAVGTITGISNLNPAFAGATLGANTVFWTHPTLDTVSLPNGTVLFNIDIVLGAAAQGATSDVVLSAIPAIIFIQDGTVQAPAVNFNEGLITISCVANDLEIAGNVFTWKAPIKPIPGVDVNLNGTIMDTEVTALPDAEYSFLVPNNANTVVNAVKIATVKNQQINVGDMLGIQAHAAQQVAFTSGYQWVAADVNGDMRVNLADYAFVQKYVLGNNPHFTDPAGLQIGPDWKFIPESFMFMPLPAGNPQAPLPNPLNSPIPPSNITRNGVMMDFLADNFVGVLIGDVNGSVIPSFTNGNVGGAETGDALKFRLDDRAIQAGEIVEIPFKSSDFTHIQAYQMTVSFDPEAFELQDIQTGVLPGLSEGNFGTDYLVDGLLSTLWVGGNPTSFNDNETLFTLTFKALKNVPTLSSVLHSSSSVTEALAIDKTGQSLDVDFEFVTTTATTQVESKVFALYQNQPNPFQSETSISFRLPETSRATLRIFSAEGRLVKTVIGEFAEGMNTIQFRQDEIGAKGVYYYELETPKHSARKKMILID